MHCYEIRQNGKLLDDEFWCEEYITKDNITDFAIEYDFFGNEGTRVDPEYVATCEYKGALDPKKRKIVFYHFIEDFRLELRYLKSDEKRLSYITRNNKTC